MKKLGLSLMVILAVAACSKSKESATTAGSNTGEMAQSGSAEGTGSAAMAGSGAAMGSGSDAAMAGSAMAGSADGSAAGSGEGSAVAMAGSGDGSGAPAEEWWDKLPHQEQMDYMKNHVVPTMKPLFQKFDAKHYANFGCKTCHGKDPKKSKYKMPNPGLPKLDFAALKAGKQKPKIAKWMGEVVKPEMAKLLKMPEYTESNPKGFGCLECHDQKK